MNIQYNKHKQELREDPVLDGLLKAKDFVKKNSNVLIGALIVIVFLVAGWVTFSYFQKNSSQKAKEAFGAAMIYYNENQIDKAIENFRITAENHRHTPQAVQSAYMIGTILYNQGKYDEASTWFESASSGNASSEFVNGQALEGLAACYEAKGDAKASLKYLEKALNDKRNQFRHPAILWKMALLNRTSDAAITRKICNQIMADTLANEYRQKAENLIAEMDVSSSN